MVKKKSVAKKTEGINPKDAVQQASNRVPLALVPPICEVLASLGHLEGSLKYGPFNWRRDPIRLSVYLEAIKRHTSKLLMGEWIDETTKVPHLASIIANCNIIADADLHGSLVDDLNTDGATPGVNIFVDFEGVIANLKNLYEKK